jgi:type IV pilus assembly protein PilN
MIKINLVAERKKPVGPKGPGILSGLTLGGNINNYVVAGLLVIGLVVVGFTYWRLSSKLSGLRAEVAENQREYERLKPIIAEVERFKVNNAELKRKIEVIEQLKAGQHGPVRLMDEVSKALPELTWLTSLNMGGNAVTVVGQALNENAVANFISNLTASPFFQEPSLRIMRQTDAGVFEFELTWIFSHTPRAAAAQAAAQS